MKTGADEESERVRDNALAASTFIEIGELDAALVLLNNGLKHVRTIGDVEELLEAGRPIFNLTGKGKRVAYTVDITQLDNTTFNVAFTGIYESVNMSCRPEDLHELVTFMWW